MSSEKIIHREGVTRRWRFCVRYALFLVLTTTTRLVAEDQASNELTVPSQPLLAQVHRLGEALEVVGRPLAQKTLDRIAAIKTLDSEEQVVAEIQKTLDPFCLAVVDIQPSGPAKVTKGSAARELSEQGWRTFLVKVINRHGRTGRMFVESPNALPLPSASAEQVESRWMQLSAYEGQPLRPNLSGLALEYRIVQIYSRDAGRKSAILEFNVSGDPKGDQELIKEWRFENDSAGWRALNQMRLKVSDGTLQIESTGEDPFMRAKVAHPGGPMKLRFQAHTDLDGSGQLFWWTKDKPQPTGSRQVSFPLHPGKDHLYEIPFSVNGELTGLRLDPLIKPGKIRIDWIDLYSTRRSKNWVKVPFDFVCERATPVTFRVFDSNGLPAFAKFEIRDSDGRIYPAQSKRLAPDFFFQRHIYRGDGEKVLLPPGDYSIECSRGPETIPITKKLTVRGRPTELVYRVNRWIDPAQAGWWSGDHHIHAAGCLHYENPTQGVSPKDMIRHIMGEDLKVGCCLTWGPCFDFQKRFFTGDVAEQSRDPYILRYDVEVSGFGSHVSGHLNLLNLKQQIYPGGESKGHWPTLGLNTLRWAKQQGAVCGPAHSAAGLTRTIGRVPNTAGKDGPNGLPNFNIPAFDGIGANEFIMDVTHRVPGADGKPVPAVDFISTMNTSRVAEWNMWYHVLNCGYRVAASGETDFPCISGDRVGMGRVYAQVDGRLTFNKWVQSVAAGRSYVSDGRCHLIDFHAIADPARKVQLGMDGSELKLDQAQEVSFHLNAAALVEGQGDLQAELIVNGYPVASRSLKADGSVMNITFKHTMRESGWIAVRVFPHAHTNPLYVVVNGKPVRGSVDSARWCLAGVEQCWKSKQNTYAAAEQAEAKAAYDHAREAFGRLIQEAGHE